MSDIPSTSPDEQEQTQLATPLALQAQSHELPAPSDVQIKETPLPLPTPAKPQYRISPLVKGILIAQSLALIIGAVVLLYLNVYEPARISAEATATTGAAFVGATSTTQIKATGYANDTATAIAESKAHSTATAIANESFYKFATKGTPIISSSLTSVDDSIGWEINYFDGAGCYFIRGAYHLRAKEGYFESCFATATNLRDFTYQVEMTLVQGDVGGIFFRASNRSGYVFFLQSDGSYTLNAGDYNPDLTQLTFTNLLHGSYSAVKPLSESNLLTVIARLNRIYLYINKEYVAEITNSTYEAGQIGVYTFTDNGPADAAFSNLKVWKL